MTKGCKGVEGCKKVTQAIGSWWFLASSFSFAFSLWPHDSQSLIEPDSDRMLGKATGEDWKEGKDWAGCWRSKRERGWEGFNGTECLTPVISSHSHSFLWKTTCLLTWPLVSHPDFPEASISCGLFSPL